MKLFCKLFLQRLKLMDDEIIINYQEPAKGNSLLYH